MLELGCGSGLPSLCALALGVEVVATDLEELPLLLLKAAYDAQELPGHLEVQQLDVLAAISTSRSSSTCPSDVQRFDVIVCSDCLYKLGSPGAWRPPAPRGSGRPDGPPLLQTTQQSFGHTS
ncbi:unnamed protein product [Durusdinium trenchii]|uniref:Uncharacterized protein n=1 Tax=Durusdinium trenchii TaxID=1381693 RepID=A0ABP0JK49_9DINO